MSHSGNKSGDSAATLAALRTEIDAVDEKLHDLIMRRAALSHDMGALKAASRDTAEGEGGSVPANPVRPAREAGILHKLAARHAGAPPFAVIVRIWRELMAANLRRQCRFELALLETDGGGLWDAAHAAYGTLTPATAYARPQDVIDAVSAAPGTLAILPAPALAPPEHCMWPELLTAAGAPRIVCALPHLAGGSWPVAFAVAHAPNEPSGDDISFLLLTGSPSQPPETNELADAGLKGRIEAVWPAMAPPGHQCAFAAVDGFLTGSEESLALLDDKRRQSGGAAFLLGTAPAPVEPPDARNSAEG